MKNKIAQIHKKAEEKRAMTEAKRGEDVLKAEEMAAKYRATGTDPTKLFGLFWSIRRNGLWCCFMVSFVIYLRKEGIICGLVGGCLGVG